MRKPMFQIGKQNTPIAALLCASYGFLEVFQFLFLWLIGGFGGIVDSWFFDFSHAAVATLLAITVFKRLRAACIAGLILSPVIGYSGIDVLLGLNWPAFTATWVNAVLVGILCMRILVCCLLTIFLLLSVFKKS
ncbi:hypothetical protein BH10ACI2_BH10ACI2_20580 [soil metagenome]